MTKPLVSFQNAGKIYKNGTVALAGLDLEVRGSEILTLLGPSGCGKSTILRLIAGLDNVSSGALTRGFELDHASIGFVFQDPTLMPWASVFDNVFLPLRLRGFARSKASPAVNEALARVGLASSGRTFPRELSGGMRMRASIARLKLNDDLLALQGELGTTIVFVTHSVFESVYLSTRIAVMAARGRAVVEIAIDAPSPRDSDFRTSSVYAHYCAQASSALQDGMGELT